MDKMLAKKIAQKLLSSYKCAICNKPVSEEEHRSTTNQMDSDEELSAKVTDMGSLIRMTVPPFSEENFDKDGGAVVCQNCVNRAQTYNPDQPREF